MLVGSGPARLYVGGGMLLESWLGSMELWEKRPVSLTWYPLEGQHSLHPPGDGGWQGQGQAGRGG